MNWNTDKLFRKGKRVG
jgi:hypothetical protein